MNSLVSVGIPAYNRPDGLRHTLECITKQTYQNLEIIVSVNESGNPETETKIADILQEFWEKDKRIRRFHQSKNIGAERNFQFVLQNATGEYFIWAADDDDWDPRFISAMVVTLEKKPGYAGAMSSTRRIDENGKYIDTTRLKEFEEENYSPLELSVFSAYHLEVAFFYNGFFRTERIRKYQHDTRDLFGKDWFIITDMIMSTHLCWVPEALFTKGYDRKRNDRVYKNDPLCWIKLWVNFPLFLLKSPNIQVQRKTWVPLIWMVNTAWIAKLYVGHFLSLVTGNPRY